MTRSSALRVALSVVILVSAACDEAREVGDHEVDRVLVVSLPGVSWDDVDQGRVPRLAAFTEDAAVGLLATRIGRRGATLPEAYLTIGAGTRAVAPQEGAAVGVESTERYGTSTAADVVQRRLGRRTESIAYLAIGTALAENEDSAYGADVGLVGDALAEAGLDRVVIANADGAEGEPDDESYGRSAVAALMGTDGTVPGGAVARTLLVDDAQAAYGVRVDPARVLEAFDQGWGSGPVVALVEASDLSRVARYGSRTSAAQRGALREQAVAGADALLAALLERVDLERDAVLVLSPVAAPGQPTLGLAALAGPGIDRGLLSSATTRRSGYVQLADVAPTVLELVGIDPPSGIEGRAFAVDGGGGGGRVGALAEAADAAAARDEAVPMVVTVFIAGLLLLSIAAVAVSRAPRLRPVLVPVGYGALGAVPATFIAGRVARPDVDVVYAALVVLGAVSVAVAASATDRRRPGLGLVLAVASVVVVIGVDIVAGAPLQLNTVFGYSVAVAGRFVGVGNLAFALFGSAAVLLAALLVDRFGDRGRKVAIGVLVAVLLIDGLPVLGADVGGVLSMVPAFGVAGLILLGRSVRLRELVLVGVAAVALLLGFAFIDLARPPESRSHLARVADNVVNGRWDALFDSVSRRWHASFGGAEAAAWSTVAVLAVITVAYVVLTAVGQAGAGGPRTWHRPTAAALAGLAVLGSVGLVANDSSFAVPMTMFLVAAPVAVVHHLERTRPGAAAA